MDRWLVGRTFGRKNSADGLISDYKTNKIVASMNGKCKTMLEIRAFKACCLNILEEQRSSLNPRLSFGESS